MNRFLSRSLILLTIFFSGQILAMNSKLKLVVNTPFNTPPADDIFVTGNFGNCHWSPHCIKLQKVGDFLFQVEIPLEQGMKFKVTRGDWANEAADSSGMPRKNEKISSKNFYAGNEVVYDIRNWKDLGSLRASGNIERVANFASPQLENERTLHIRLPDDYNQIGNKKTYPVIYMHDGQNCFDPKTATFGTDWAVDEVLSAMVDQGQVRDAIVVGVFSVNRGNEYNDASLGKLYGKFIVETVKPFIEQNYRVQTGPENTFLMGSSFGSAISVSMAWRYPHVFGKIAGVAFNGSFFGNHLFRLTSSLPLTSTKLYLDHGDINGDRYYARGTQRFIQHIKSLGMNDDQFVYQVFPYSSHTEADWARRVHVPLKFLLQ